MLETLKGIIEVLNSFSSVGIVGGFIIIIIYLISGKPNFLKRFQQSVKNNVAGLSFEERIAFVESKTLRMETNHIAHIKDDVQELRADIAAILLTQQRIESGHGDLRERVARLEGRRYNK